MKKIENSFAVTGFVGKDAEIRQFANTSVARFSMAVSVKRKTVMIQTVSRHSSMWKHGVRTRKLIHLKILPRAHCSQLKVTSNLKSGPTKRVSSTTESSWLPLLSIRLKKRKKSLKALQKERRSSNILSLIDSGFGRFLFAR